MMNKEEFFFKYKTLGGVLAGDFYDSEEVSDEILAEKILTQDWAHPDATRLLVDDSERLLRSIDQEWQLFGKIANRYFENVDEARAWLLSVYVIWEKALRKLDGEKPS